jgi:biotin operon repressor
LTDAIVLSHVQYLTQGRMANGKRRGHRPQPDRGLPGHWTAQSSGDLAKATGLTEYQVDHALRRLREQGLIVWKVGLFNACPTRHICLKDEALDVTETDGPGRPIAFRPWLMSGLRNALQGKDVALETVALVASQLLYWHTRRHKDRSSILWPAEPDSGIEHPFFWKANVSLADEIGVSKYRINRAMEALRQAGLVKTKAGLRSQKRTNRVMLPPTAWRSLLNDLEQKSAVCSDADASDPDYLFGDGAGPESVNAPPPER